MPIIFDPRVGGSLVGHLVGSISVALTSYQHIFDPHVIVLGGGVAQAGELLLAPIRRTMSELGSPYYLKHLQAIRPAALGAEAGLIGAAGLILLPDHLP